MDNKLNSPMVMVIIHLSSLQQCTFTKGWRAVPLGGVSWDTVDDDLADQLVVLIAEEAQGFPRLVAVLVQRLVTVVGNAWVRTRVVLHCFKGHTDVAIENEKKFAVVLYCMCGEWLCRNIVVR